MRGTQRGFTLIEMMVVVAIIGILSALIMSVSTRSVGANARNSSEQIVSMINLAKLRASSTRKIHRIQVEPQRLSLWALSVTGLVIPTSPVWSLVQSTTLPAPIKIWDATAGATTTVGATITEDTTLSSSPYDLDIRPDGQATATTLWVTDGNNRVRVLTYHVTGGSYVRDGW